MWMPSDQFFDNRIERIVDVKTPALRRHLREENSFEQQIAELFRQPRPIPPVDGIQHLVRFLEQVRLDAVEILLAIPRAAIRPAQPRHDLDQPLKFFSGTSA